MVCKTPMAMRGSHVGTGEATVPCMMCPCAKEGKRKLGESWAAVGSYGTLEAMLCRGDGHGPIHIGKREPASCEKKCCRRGRMAKLAIGFAGDRLFGPPSGPTKKN